MNIRTLTLNPVVDKSTEVSRVIPDRKLRCRAPRFEPGGGGINVARAIVRLGGKAEALYPAGGHSGALLDELLEAEGTPHRAVAIEEPTRINLMVSEEETGQQFRFGMPGARLTPDDWQGLLDLAFDSGATPDFLVVSGSLPPGVSTDFHRELAQRAAQHDCRLVVDSSHEGLRQAMEVGVYLVKPNLRELRQLVGDESIGEEAEVRAAAREVVHSGKSQCVVVSLGGAGAVVVEGDICYQMRAPHVATRSRVGAGDSMLAGIVLALARGQPVSEAVVYGVAAGTAAVMTPGSELCRREDVERLRTQVTVAEEAL